MTRTLLIAAGEVPRIGLGTNLQDTAEHTAFVHDAIGAGNRHSVPSQEEAGDHAQEDRGGVTQERGLLAPAARRVSAREPAD